MTEVKATWLPNLVAGVSIWKLAVDLNEPKFFEGRLVIPETEGSDSLPINVRWNVAGLLPLGEARAKHPDEATQAIRDFFACVEKVQAELASPTSGFRKFKEAFTVPSLESDEGKNYFFSAQQKKLFVINWGASPRAIAGQSQLVFGFDDFGQLFEKNGIARDGGGGGGGGAALATAAVVGAAAGAVAVEALKPGEKKDDKKKDDKKKDDEKPWLLWGRPWWVWLLVLLAAIALVLLILFLLRGCESLQTGPDGGAESAEAGADAASDAGLDAASDGSSDAAAASDADDGGDAGSKDAATDARDGGDAGDASDGGKDGGKKDGGDAGGDDGPGGPGSGGPGGAGGPGGSGTVTIILAPGGGSGGPAGDSGERTLRYSQPGAAAWKVVAGKELLAPGSASDGTGETFEVHLKPGASMNGVKVEWQDQGGKWHL